MKQEDSLTWSEETATCPCCEPDQSSSSPRSWRSILILPYRLRLRLPSGICPSGFLTKILYAHILSSSGATSPSRIIILRYLITHQIFGEECKPLGSALWKFLHSFLCSKYLAQHLIPEYPQPMFFFPTWYKRSSFVHTQNCRQNYSFVKFN